MTSVDRGRIGVEDVGGPARAGAPVRLHRRQEVRIEVVEAEYLLGGLGLAVTEVRRAVEDTEQRRALNPSPPNAAATASGAATPFTGLMLKWRTRSGW